MMLLHGCSLLLLLRGRPLYGRDEVVRLRGCYEVTPGRRSSHAWFIDSKVELANIIFTMTFIGRLDRARTHGSLLARSGLLT